MTLLTKRQFDRLKENPHVNVLGKYVCKKDDGRDNREIFIDEDAKTIRFGEAIRKITRSNKEALYAEESKSSDGDVALQWVFYRLGENPTATHDTISADWRVRVSSVTRFGDVITTDVSHSYTCEKQFESVNNQIIDAEQDE